MHRRLLARTAPLGLVLTLALTGCGTDDTDDPNTPTGTSEQSTTPEPTDTPSEEESTATEEESEAPSSVITLNRVNGEFSPSGERVKVSAGEEFTIAIDSDEAGTLHVHSTPEQEIAYEKGLSAHTLKLEQPGIVEVESHDPDAVVLQLQVS